MTKIAKNLNFVDHEAEEVFEGSDLQRTAVEVDLLKAFIDKCDEEDPVQEAAFEEKVSDDEARLQSKANRQKRLKDKVLKDKHYKRGAAGKTKGVAMPVCEMKKIQRTMPKDEYRERAIRGEFQSPLQENQDRRAYRLYNSRPQEVRSTEKIQLKKNSFREEEPVMEEFSVQEEVMETPPYFSTIEFNLNGHPMRMCLASSAMNYRRR